MRCQVSVCYDHGDLLDPEVDSDARVRHRMIPLWALERAVVAYDCPVPVNHDDPDDPWAWLCTRVELVSRLFPLSCGGWGASLDSTHKITLLTTGEYCLGASEMEAIADFAEKVNAEVEVTVDPHQDFSRDGPRRLRIEFTPREDEREEVKTFESDAGE
jgi:hypothetical protein